MRSGGSRNAQAPQPRDPLPVQNARHGRETPHPLRAVCQGSPLSEQLTSPPASNPPLRRLTSGGCGLVFSPLFPTTDVPNDAIIDTIKQLSRPGGFRSSIIGGNLIMALALARISISTRRKLTSILLAVTIFALLAGLATLAQGRPVVFGVLNAIFVGTGVGLFEQYYV